MPPVVLKWTDTDPAIDYDVPTLETPSGDRIVIDASTGGQVEVAPLED